MNCHFVCVILCVYVIGLGYHFCLLVVWFSVLLRAVGSGLLTFKIDGDDLFWVVLLVSVIYIIM